MTENDLAWGHNTIGALFLLKGYFSFLFQFTSFPLRLFSILPHTLFSMAAQQEPDADFYFRDNANAIYSASYNSDRSHREIVKFVFLTLRNITSAVHGFPIVITFSRVGLLETKVKTFPLSKNAAK